MSGATIVCPCCLGKAVIPAGPPVVLSPMGTKVYNAVRSAKYGINIHDLADKVYADRIDGGPSTANEVVRVSVNSLNKLIVAAGEKIEARDRRYRLHRITLKG